MKNVRKIKMFWLQIFKFKILQIFGNKIWNPFFSNVQDTWTYIVIKFSAIQLHPYLKANVLNAQEDSMTTFQGEKSYFFWLKKSFQGIFETFMNKLECLSVQTVARLIQNAITVMLSQCYTPSKEKRRFLYSIHLSKEFLEQMIPHLKALI